jgi:DnaK suppressor protein
MTQSEKQYIKELISQEINTLEIQIKQLEQRSTTIAKDCSLDALNKVDMHYEHQREYTLVEQAKKRVESLHTTLLHVDDEDFGICQECEEEIPFARVELLPESRYCVECLNEQNR